MLEELILYIFSEDKWQFLIRSHKCSSVGDSRQRLLKSNMAQCPYIAIMLQLWCSLSIFTFTQFFIALVTASWIWRTTIETSASMFKTKIAPLWPMSTIMHWGQSCNRGYSIHFLSCIHSTIYDRSMQFLWPADVMLRQLQARLLDS